MKIIRFDAGFRFDDKNAFFGKEDGAPAFLLEKGDEGWVDPNPPPPPDSTPQPTKPKPRNKMPKSDYINNRDVDFAAQMITFKTNIGQYATTLDVTTAQMTAQANDADSFDFVVKKQRTCVDCGQQWTAWKDLMRGGGTPPAAARRREGIPPVISRHPGAGADVHQTSRAGRQGHPRLVPEH